MRLRDAMAFVPATHIIKGTPLPVDLVDVLSIAFQVHGFASLPFQVLVLVAGALLLLGLHELDGGGPGVGEDLLGGGLGDALRVGDAVLLLEGLHGVALVDLEVGLALELVDLLLVLDGLEERVELALHLGQLVQFQVVVLLLLDQRVDDLPEAVVLVPDRLQGVGQGLVLLLEVLPVIGGLLTWMRVLVCCRKSVLVWSDSSSCCWSYSAYSRSCYSI